jgi:hypothetical protein
MKKNSGRKPDQTKKEKPAIEDKKLADVTGGYIQSNSTGLQQ